MFSQSCRLLGVLCAALVADCGTPKAPLVVIDLRSTGDTVRASLGTITEAVWLDDLHWVILAPDGPALGAADFNSHRVVRWGATRSDDYRQPVSLFRGGDSIYLGDWAMRRLTVWNLDGKLVGTIAATDSLRGVLPHARDAEGQFYLEFHPRAGPDGGGNRDSTTVLRANRLLTRADTVARLSPPDLAVVNGNSGRRFERRALSGLDRWGVLPDGTVWVARVFQNRVDWLGRGGHLTQGDPLPDAVLPVTAADREIFLRGFPKDLRGPAEELPFAPIKPPFEDAHAGPDTRVWLEKSRAYGDTLRLYHVVDRAGKLVRAFRYRGDGHLLAVGSRSVLIAEAGADAVLLIRYEIPQ
jgi:hypothetical protein